MDCGLPFLIACLLACCLLACSTVSPTLLHNRRSELHNNTRWLSWLDKEREGKEERQARKAKVGEVATSSFLTRSYISRGKIEIALTGRTEAPHAWYQQREIATGVRDLL